VPELQASDRRRPPAHDRQEQHEPGQDEEQVHAIKTVRGNRQQHRVLEEDRCPDEAAVEVVDEHEEDGDPAQEVDRRQAVGHPAAGVVVPSAGLHQSV